MMCKLRTFALGLGVWLLAGSLGYQAVRTIGNVAYNVMAESPTPEPAAIAAFALGAATLAVTLFCLCLALYILACAVFIVEEAAYPWVRKLYNGIMKTGEYVCNLMTGE